MMSADVSSNSGRRETDLLWLLDEAIAEIEYCYFRVTLNP